MSRLCSAPPVSGAPAAPPTRWGCPPQLRRCRQGLGPRQPRPGAAPPQPRLCMARWRVLAHCQRPPAQPQRPQVPPGTVPRAPQLRGSPACAAAAIRPHARLPHPPLQCQCQAPPGQRARWPLHPAQLLRLPVPLWSSLPLAAAAPAAAGPRLQQSTGPAVTSENIAVRQGHLMPAILRQQPYRSKLMLASKRYAGNVTEDVAHLLITEKARERTN